MGKPKVQTPNIPVTGVFSWSMSISIDYRLVGDVSWTHAGDFVITNATRSNFRRIFRQDGLASGQYEIRITRKTAANGDKQIGDVHLTSIDEIRNENIAYVNSALLAVHMLANNQISGAIPNISCIVGGKKVAFYQ